MIFRLLCLLLLALPFCGMTRTSNPRIGKYGDFSFADQEFKLNFCTPEWVFHTPSRKNFQFDSGFPIRSEDRYELRGKLTAGHILSLYERIDLPADGSMKLNAAIESREDCPVSSVHFSTDLSIQEFRNKTILVNGSPVNHGGRLSGGKKSLFFPKAGRVEIPLSAGRLVITGSFILQIQDASAWGGRWNFRFRMNSGSLLRKAELNVVLRLEPYSAHPVSLADAANMGFADERAEDQTGGWTDQGPENDLRMFPVGKHSFSGVPFQIVDPRKNHGRSCIVLRGKSRPWLPEMATLELPDGRTGKYLYLLNAVAWPGKGKAGEITVEYANAKLVEKEEQTFFVENEKNTANFWGAHIIPDAEIGWTGHNASSKLGLYLTCFELLEKPVRRITFRSEGKMVWMIAGVSLCDRVPATPGKREKVVIRADREWMPIGNSSGIQAGSILDFSGNLERPAGKYGFLKVANGHFEFSGRPGVPVRFYGVNIVGDVHFMENQEIDRVADEFAATGYNQVRFHHFDNYLKRKGEKSTVLDPERMDRLDYWIAALKKRGIYVTFDLYTSRRLTKGEIPEYPDAAIGGNEYKALVFVNENARRNFKEFSLNLLNHVNPYTGVAWKEERAIANLSLLNEDSIYATVDSSPRVRAIYERNFKQWLSRSGRNATTQNRKHLREMFLLETYEKGYRELAEFLQNAGLKVPITDQNFWTRIPLTVMRSKYHFTDHHFYWSHPVYLGGYRPPMNIASFDAVERFAGGLGGLFSSRIYGKPFSVSEWNHCVPSSFSMQGVFLMSAYAGYQNWDSLNRFAYSHSAGRIRSPRENAAFDLTGNPVRMLSERVGVCFFLRGDVRPAGVQYLVLVHENPWKNGTESVYPIAIQKLGFVGGIGSLMAGDRGPNRLPAGTKALLYLEKKRIAESSVPLFRAGKADLYRAMLERKVLSESDFSLKQNSFRSDTGEIFLESGKKRFSVINYRSEGFLLGEGGTGKGKLVCVDNRKAYAGFLFASVDGNSLKESNRILILHLTDCKNSGMTFRNSEMSLLEDWGKLPLLIRRGRADVTVYRDLSGFSLYALDSCGKRMDLLEMKHAGRESRFSLQTDRKGSAVIAYELIRAESR